MTEPGPSVQEQADALSKGGVWSQENIEQPLEWKGEISKSAAKKLRQRAAKEKKKQDESQTPSSAHLSSHPSEVGEFEDTPLPEPPGGLGTTTGELSTVEEVARVTSLAPEIVDAVVSLARKVIIRDLGFGGTSVRVAMSKLVDESARRTHDWVTNEVSTLRALQVSSAEAQVQSLTTRLSLLEAKMSELTSKLISRSEEENRIMNDALRIVHDSKGESDDGASSEVVRMQLRQVELEREVDELRGVASSLSKKGKEPDQNAGLGSTRRARGRLY